MDPSSLTGMISGIAEGGSSTAAAIWQYHKAKELEKEAGARPLYQTPASAQQALELSRERSLMNKYPGQDLYENQVQQRTANQVGTIQDTASTSVGALEAARRSYLDENNLMDKSQINNLNWQDEAQKAYRNQLMANAGYQDKEWELNKWNRYKDYSLAAQQMNAAAINNFFKGVSAGNYGGSQGMGNISNNRQQSQQNTSNYTQPTYGNPIDNNYDYVKTNPQANEQNLSSYGEMNFA